MDFKRWIKSILIAIAIAALIIAIGYYGQMLINKYREFFETVGCILLLTVICSPFISMIYGYVPASKKKKK